jgi:hypothetical protein
MRIGFDMDGVVADLHTAFAGAAMRVFPDLDPALVAQPEVGASPPTTEADAEDSEVPEAPPVEAAGLPLTRRQLDRVWDRIAGIEDFWETLRETEPGIVSRIATIAEERRWEVIFLTSRPSTRGRTVQRQSQRWLDGLGFPMPSVFVVQGSRGRIADALHLDVVIDDRPDNCLDVVLESKARAILIWRGAPSAIPGSARRMGIAIDHTLSSCLDKLVEAEKAADTPADLMQRLRRLFGLSKPG